MKFRLAMFISILMKNLPGIQLSSGCRPFALVLSASALLMAVNSLAALPSASLRVVSISRTGLVKVAGADGEASLTKGQQWGRWTLMAVIHGSPKHQLAVFEDFSVRDGHLLFADGEGVKADLPKSLEPTFADPAGLYRGHTLNQVLNSDRDILAEEILAKPGDPDYGEVSACFAPISRLQTWTFLGTRECLEKVGIFYGGSTPNFDPAAYIPDVEKIRKAGSVWDGLVGGWLPAVRFVYPEAQGNWSELVAYAPMRIENGNTRVQPVWYRVSRVEGNRLLWVRYFDSYHPFPPRIEQGAKAFYEELLSMRSGWQNAMAPGMTIDIPDQHLADMARHSLVRDMMTRVGAFPKYGVFERSYGGSEHDGFPDTFNADTTAMLEWGMFDLAREYIDNYFTFFVRNDGSILYRGPETGQFGRILTVVAQYANYTGDGRLLLKHRRRLDAIAGLLLDLRAKALRLSRGDTAYGLIVGWSEADACLDPEPLRYMQPYFSNSTEAGRGFKELGRVWERIGRTGHQRELSAWGQRLQQESRTLAADVQIAIARSVLTNTIPPCLPAIAGVKEPFDVAMARDKLDPQFRSYRPYMEMLYSGNLTREQVEMVVNYRAAHRDTILGVPTAYGYNTHELAGFLSYGHGYGLLQHDHVREYLLSLYSLMAHQYTRGSWIAPETRRFDPKQFAAPYCTPAQMVVPLITRWMLVFEDPASETLWLAKGTPRSWLENGKSIAVSNAPTPWGLVGFQLRSELNVGRIEAALDLPAKPLEVSVKLRLRTPDGHRIRSVLLGGKPWTDFEPQEETVTLPRTAKGRLNLLVGY